MKKIYLFSVSIEVLLYAAMAVYWFADAQPVPAVIAMMVSAGELAGEIWVITYGRKEKAIILVRSKEEHGMPEDRVRIKKEIAETVVLRDNEGGMRKAG